MIKYIKGDLLRATEGYIVHGCNCQGVMGSGVALAIKNKYPDAYYDYINYVSAYTDTSIRGRNLLGDIQYTKVTDKLTIANAFTQQFYGKDGKQYASYAAIEDVMQSLKDFTSLDTHIHMPRIGCGYGGLDWSEVSQYIEYYLANHNVTIYEL